MAVIQLKPGNMLNPVPAVMISCGDLHGVSNIITVAWAGTVCSDPPMVSISVRPSRHSYALIDGSGEFVINLVTEKLVRAMDFCGVRSGRDVDKWKECGLTPLPANTVRCPVVGESPVHIECRVVSKKELGTHHMFLAEVTAVTADGRYMDENGRLDLEAAHLIAYSHGVYHSLGRELGSFGFSVRKKPFPKHRKKRFPEKTVRKRS